MKLIIKILLISLIVVAVGQAYSIYRVLNKSSIRMFDLANIQPIFSDNKSIKIDIDNPTSRNISFKDVTLTIMKDGRIMGGFMPLDLLISKGQNSVVLVFTNNTKYGQIAIDYATNQLKSYDLILRGNWLGIVPIKYTYPMKNIV